ncbi:hypothetical protein AAHA92_17743 [Salvia divinorum]|uniref:Uncharacterized protein n=1 Tax=Salvia divinorum TaxID=28513 RepID=A0ABD1H2Z0_SALDI
MASPAVSRALPVAARLSRCCHLLFLSSLEERSLRLDRSPLCHASPLAAGGVCVLLVSGCVAAVGLTSTRRGA